MDVSPVLLGRVFRLGDAALHGVQEDRQGDKTHRLLCSGAIFSTKSPPILYRPGKTAAQGRTQRCRAALARPICLWALSQDWASGSFSLADESLCPAGLPSWAEQTDRS